MIAPISSLKQVKIVRILDCCVQTRAGGLNHQNRKTPLVCYQAQMLKICVEPCTRHNQLKQEHHLCSAFPCWGPTTQPRGFSSALAVNA